MSSSSPERDMEKSSDTTPAVPHQPYHESGTANAPAYEDKSYDEKAYDPAVGEKSAGFAVSPNVYHEVVTNSGSTEEEMAIEAEDGVQRGLKQRHVQMIAIGGTIGTGLFLGIGGALATAGPAGCLLAYIIIGTSTYAMLMSLGEMAARWPQSGSFTTYATRFVDPALGFACGYIYLYNALLTVPTEMSAAADLVGFWIDVNPAAWVTIFFIAVIPINLFGARWFGESEFIFSTLKVMLITGLIIMAFILDLGGGPNHDRLGFRYWQNPGAFNTQIADGNWGRFLAFYQALIQAIFSYGGTELIAIAAAETRDPERNIPKAIRRTFYRLIVFYVIGTLAVGVLVAYDDPALGASGTSASPWVIAINNAGIPALPSIVNAVIITSAFSAGSSYLYTSSRMLYGLALRRQAPAIFRKTNRWGLPWTALILSCCFVPLAYLVASDSASTAFGWLSGLVATAQIWSNSIICISYIRYYHAAKLQNWDRKALAPYRGHFQPYAAYWALFINVLLIFTNSYEVFTAGNWSPESFVTGYLSIPLMFIFYFGFKIINKTKIVPLSEINLQYVPAVEVAPMPPPTTIGGKIWNWLF